MNVQTKSMLRIAPRPMRCPISPMAAMEEMWYRIYPTMVRMEPEVRMDGMLLFKVSTAAASFSMVFRQAM